MSEAEKRKPVPMHVFTDTPLVIIWIDRKGQIQREQIVEYNGSDPSPQNSPHHP